MTSVVMMHIRIRDTLMTGSIGNCAYFFENGFSINEFICFVLATERVVREK